jgi:hypothetical protein
MSICVPLLAAADGSAGDFDPNQVFSSWTKVIAVEVTFAHFGARLDNRGAAVQAWNLAGRFSLLPIGVTRLRFLGGALDGALEVGLQPTFQRFNTQHQNFGGLGLDLRYNLLHFRWGPLVPWIDASIAPGGTDLRIGKVNNQTGSTAPS